MRLLDCHPRWETIPNWSSPSLFAVGLIFTCPVCRYPVLCSFKPAIDPDGLQAKYQWPDFPALDGGPQWARTGETFETLSLAPSINNDRAGCGHWTLTGGELHESAPHGPRIARTARSGEEKGGAS